jgi:isopentenyldiphosphate isomerase
MWGIFKKQQSIQQSEVLDEAGHKTGQILDRKTVHDKQLWHEVVNVWVINSKGEILLQLRAPGVEISPGVWDVAVGSHVRPGEDPLVAAQRCLNTELGIDILPGSIKHLFNIRAANPMSGNKKHHVLGHVFLLKRDIDPADITVDTKKITRLEWKPLLAVMSEVGATDTTALYFPREGDYYPKVFDALQNEMGDGLTL